MDRIDRSAKLGHTTAPSSRRRSCTKRYGEPGTALPLTPRAVRSPPRCRSRSCAIAGGRAGCCGARGRARKPLCGRFRRGVWPGPVHAPIAGRRSLLLHEFAHMVQQRGEPPVCPALRGHLNPQLNPRRNANAGGFPVRLADDGRIAVRQDNSKGSRQLFATRRPDSPFEQHARREKFADPPRLRLDGAFRDCPDVCRARQRVAGICAARISDDYGEVDKTGYLR